MDYEYIPERRFSDRQFFPKGPPEKRTHHLNLVEITSDTGWKNQLLFRDYLVMIERKTSVLVAAATGVTGLIAGLPKEEQEALWTYGLNLGLAYQLTDDMVSIWADPKFTGKKYGNDLHRRIKSLPVLRAYSELSSIDKASFAKLYAQNNDFTDTEIKNLVSLIDSTDAYQYTLAKVGVHKDLAGKALDQTTLNTAQKTSLREITQALLPDVSEMRKDNILLR